MPRCCAIRRAVRRRWQTPHVFYGIVPDFLLNRAHPRVTRLALLERNYQEQWHLFGRTVEPLANHGARHTDRGSAVWPAAVPGDDGARASVAYSGTGLSILLLCLPLAALVNPKAQAAGDCGNPVRSRAVCHRIYRFIRCSPRASANLRTLGPAVSGARLVLFKSDRQGPEGDRGKNDCVRLGVQANGEKERGGPKMKDSERETRRTGPAAICREIKSRDCSSRLA